MNQASGNLDVCVTGDAPRVSIITTVLNGAAYLAEAIESVLQQQTSQHWELLIVDDGSADDSHEIALRYSRLAPDRIHVLSHPGRVNQGISASRNLGLAQARGEFLAFLDADDVWLPHLLETQVRLLEEHTEAAMVYASAERWLDFDQPFHPRAGSSGRNFVPPLIPSDHRAGIIAPGRLLEWFRADESMTPCTCTVLVRTAVARRLGGFVNSFRGLYDDQAFYAKLSLAEQIYVHLGCVARYRQHPASCCAAARRSLALHEEEHRSFQDWLESYSEQISMSLAGAGALSES